MSMSCPIEHLPTLGLPASARAAARVPISSGGSGTRQGTRLPHRTWQTRSCEVGVLNACNARCTFPLGRCPGCAYGTTSAYSVMCWRPASIRLRSLVAPRSRLNDVGLRQQFGCRNRQSTEAGPQPRRGAYTSHANLCAPLWQGGIRRCCTTPHQSVRTVGSNGSPVGSESNSQPPPRH